MQMHILLPAAAIFIASAPVLAQTLSGTTAGTTASATSTDLVGLVNSLPLCALGCFKTAASLIKCNASDLPCICGKPEELARAIAPCLLTESGCKPDDEDVLAQNARELCQGIGTASASEIAAASSAVNSALSNAPVAASSTSTSLENLAARTDSPVVAMGAMGAAAALAALALYLEGAL